ncbi:hypothetical protein [Hydrogenophaga sp.]|uniref:hypothetical protein n=1 Tax=Hydrogenophaga sp. TaxID=1904254 RepID=UPI00273111FF|nr:hypothetical protein [Hydrogenophaga sp.]MDP2015733.1 hypothetical protein [Hydrogenophaga sp.]MDP3164000.1 hypothetical protein [Hydrogenophaga sp.]MDP3810424.1 hypothetical protein [Hydrogenophaga sp.]
MNPFTSRLALLAVAISFQAAPALAQSVMTAPACQCSAPTLVVTGGASVVHCMCGAMSCVITLPTASSKDTSQLQCVK